MIVIAVIGIMTSVGLVSLSPAKKDATTKAARNEVTAAIKLAQSYALQGRVVTGVKVCGYGFEFTDNDTYQIFYYTADSDCNGDKIKFLVETQDLKEGVLLTSFSSIDDTTIYFKIPSAEISYENGGFPKTFEFNSDKTISINSAGLVTEN